jgi:hypothetical protein
MPFGMFVGVNNHFQSILFAGVNNLLWGCYRTVLNSNWGCYRTA